MNAQEATLLKSLFDRLRSAENQPRDQEAEMVIADAVRSQTTLPYLLTQSLLLAEQALTANRQRIVDLERQLADRASTMPASAPGISFLGQSASGPWGRAPEPTPGIASNAPVTAVPASVSSVPPQRRGFLAGAVQTASGVAGGLLAAEAIGSLFHHGGGYGGGLFSSEAPSFLDERVVNNYFENPTTAADGAPDDVVAGDESWPDDSDDHT